MSSFKHTSGNTWPRGTRLHQWHQRQEKRPWEKPSTSGLLPYKPRRRISLETKELLKKKLFEIEAHNASRGYEEAASRKERRARCYACRKWGHYFWKCQDRKPESFLEGKQKHVEETKYPEQVHVKTTHMIKWTDYANWSHVWYISDTYNNHMCPTKSLFRRIKPRFLMEGKEEDEKKFIFSYGVGEAIVETNEKKMIIPCVSYTPEASLNVLSAKQLLAQGFEVTYEDDECKVSYMFDDEEMGHEGKKVVGESSSMAKEHDKFLDDYYASIDPKETCMNIKGLEDLEWKDGMIHDYLDEEFLSMNGTLYIMKVNSFNKFISFLIMIEDDNLVYKNWNVLSKHFEEMIKWFYQVYLGRIMVDPLPPVINGIKIDLLGLYKIICSLRGYLGVTFGNQWGDVALIHGLGREQDEELKECYKRDIDLVRCYFETTLRARGKIAKKEGYGKAPKIEEGSNEQWSQEGNAQVLNTYGNKDTWMDKKDSQEKMGV